MLLEALSILSPFFGFDSASEMSPGPTSNSGGRPCGFTPSLVISIRNGPCGGRSAPQTGGLIRMTATGTPSRRETVEIKVLQRILPSSRRDRRSSPFPLLEAKITRPYSAAFIIILRRQCLPTALERLPPRVRSGSPRVGCGRRCRGAYAPADAGQAQKQDGGPADFAGGRIWSKHAVESET